MLVLIGTTVVYLDWGFANFRFSQLPLLTQTGHTGVVPTVVFEEQWGQLNRQFRDWWQRRPTKLSDVFAVPDISASELDARFGHAREQNRVELVQSGVTIAPYPEVTHAELVQRAVTRRKPFREVGGDKQVTGYDDTLIWYTLMEIASATSEEVAFISKIRRGRLHVSGRHNRSGHSFRSKPCSYGCPETPRNRSANARA